MAELLTIGDVARALGVPASTLRYYERIGLVRPSARSPSNYRLHTGADVERLRFARAAQANGFTLEDISELLVLRSAKSAPPREVAGIPLDLEPRFKPSAARGVGGCRRRKVNAMKKFALVTGVAAAAIAGGALAYGALATPKSTSPSSAGATKRVDSPGTIICPLTGEEIRNDACPLCATKSE